MSNFMTHAYVAMNWLSQKEIYVLKLTVNLRDTLWRFD